MISKQQYYRIFYKGYEQGYWQALAQNPGGMWNMGAMFPQPPPQQMFTPVPASQPVGPEATATSCATAESQTADGQPGNLWNPMMTEWLQIYLASLAAAGQQPQQQQQQQQQQEEAGEENVEEKTETVRKEPNVSDKVERVQMEKESPKEEESEESETETEEENDDEEEEDEEDLDDSISDPDEEQIVNDMFRQYNYNRLNSSSGEKESLLERDGESGDY